MLSQKHLNKIFNSAKQISINDLSKIVIMGDCHRGDGSWADTFSKNQNIYFAALTHYYNNYYTYIELGDGDELWKNTKLSSIIHMHKDVFWLLSKFYKKNKLYFVFGNHDMLKKSNQYLKQNFYCYFDERLKKSISLFNNIKVHESLILKHEITGKKIFLLHGHQVDFFNYRLWRLSRFFVKYLWKPLEIFGVNDPTSTARNYKRKESVDNKLTKWAISENKMIIAGHTHRPVFPEIDNPQYFNIGSCVHPRCITAIEIANDNILLVKWSIKTKNDGALFIGRQILAGPKKL